MTRSGRPCRERSESSAPRRRRRSRSQEGSKFRDSRDGTEEFEDPEYDEFAPPSRSASQSLASDGHSRSIVILPSPIRQSTSPLPSPRRHSTSPLSSPSPSPSPPRQSTSPLFSPSPIHSCTSTAKATMFFLCLYI